MSQQITTAFVKQYGSNVDLLTQQKGSKLRSAVMEEGQSAEKKFKEHIGATEVEEVTTRHGDSPQVDTPHDRRMSTVRFFDWGDFVDDNDKVLTLIDPANPYAQNAAYAMGRKIDDLLIAAFDGSAWSGKEGTTEVIYDTNNTIAYDFATYTGLTKAKLIEARRILLAGDVDLDNEEAHIAVGASQLANLLNDPKLTSTDYMNVQGLIEGKISYALGFRFHVINRLKFATNRYCPFWVKSGMLLVRAKEITSRITERSDKRFSMYVYVKMGFGATRMEEKKVGLIACAEPGTVTA